MPDWTTELTAWLEPFLNCLGHKARRKMCPLYVAGLIGPSERKSMEPLAARVAAGKYDRLHHFISDGVWDAASLEAQLARQANRLVGGSDAVLIIDDTALPKKGRHSVGVAPQYAGVLGKRANCQALVSLTLARDDVPVAVGLRLFLPQAWTSDPDRLDAAGVPEAFKVSRTKPQIALAEIDRLMTQGVRFRTVLADAGYGLSAPLRQGLSARGLTWAVGIPKHQKVYRADVSLVFPVTGGGRPRKNAFPDQLSMPAEAMLASANWTELSWRPGTKGPLKARFAAVRIRIADGPPQRIHDKGQQHMPGEEAWLVGELRASGERKYHLATLPADVDLKTLAATVKARWSCEQAHQQMKEELGLDHFEGRSWRGLHRHTLMVMIAYAFLQHRRLAEAKGEKNTMQGRPSGTATTNASRRPTRRHRRAQSIPLAKAMSPLQNDLTQKAGIKLPK